ncbi:MAG: hypothetical protein P4M11_12585 [Candidatus Pacebacteria bacterium]|nr:hypothetical protein [Candidatus Paceibacterota bacterium]
MLIAIIVLTYKFSDKSTSEIVGTGRYVDITNKITMYDAIFCLEAILIFMLVYRFLCVFRLNPYIDLIYKTVTTSAYLMVTYAVILFLFLMSCALFIQVVWGGFLVNYKSFDRSFMKVLTGIVGAMDTSSWMYKASDWSIVYVILFYIWVAYLLPNVIVGIFMESYRISALEIGYPETQKDKKWGVKSYIAWALDDCCPASLKHRFGLTEDRGSEQPDEEEEEKKAQTK